METPLTIQQLLEEMECAPTTMRMWIRKAAKEVPSIQEKTKAAVKGCPAKFNRTEVEAILRQSPRGRSNLRIFHIMEKVAEGDPETVEKVRKWFGPHVLENARTMVKYHD